MKSTCASNKMRRTFQIIILLIGLFFVFYPIFKNDLHIKIIVEGDIAEDFYLYYTTTDSPDFIDSQKVVANKKVTKTGNTLLDFALPKETENKISDIRIDLPHNTDLYKITQVYVSSRSIIRKQINPLHFFGSTNILYTNEINEISYVDSRNWVYISTGDNDPFIVFNEDYSMQLDDYR